MCVFVIVFVCRLFFQRQSNYHYACIVNYIQELWITYDMIDPN